MRKIKYLALLFFIIFITGCDFFKQDTMEGINIITTIYPIEYTINYLYGDNAVINSVYPDGTNIDEYTLTEKQLKDNSHKDLFIYMGLNSKDSDQAISYLERNRNIKLIDTSFGMEYVNGNEELWLNPSNLLMMAQNIKNGLTEYISSAYLTKDLQDKYNLLKSELSELDADIKLSIENADKNTIFTNSNSLKYLEKYGLTVIVLNKENDQYEKNYIKLNNYIKNNKTKNIFIMENTEVSEEIQTLINNGTIKSLTFRNLKNITDEERNNGTNYVSLTKANIETLKKEIYN